MIPTSGLTRLGLDLLLCQVRGRRSPPELREEVLARSGKFSCSGNEGGRLMPSGAGHRGAEPPAQPYLRGTGRGATVGRD